MTFRSTLAAILFLSALLAALTMLCDRAPLWFALAIGLGPAVLACATEAAARRDSIPAQFFPAPGKTTTQGESPCP